MSTDFSIRPVGAPAATPVVQPPERGGQQRGCDRTAGEPKRHGSGRERRPCATIRRPRAITSRIRRSIDQAAASIVYQVVDGRTNQVVEQYPDEAVLRRRAYFHTLDLTKTRRRVLATDRKA